MYLSFRKESLIKKNMSEDVNKENLVTSIKEPLPPFKYHVYIGHSVLDSSFIMEHKNSLVQILEKYYSITCYPRYQIEGRFSIKERIDEGVAECQKCLVVMTKNYFTDEYINYEIQTIRRKGKRFSKEMIIVLWLNCELQKSTQLDFQEYCHILLTKENLKTPEHLLPLVEAITEPLKPNLTCMPKENIGYGYALGFFFGFLHLVLPDFCSRFDQAMEGDPNALSNMKARSVRKMMIILPRSCFCSVTIQSKGRIENVDGFFVKRNTSRAGNIYRDYKSSVYKLTDDSQTSSRDKEYYFAGELATPLLTMYETYRSGLTGMTIDQLYEERDAFCYTLYNILQHPNNAQCNDQCRLIMWDDQLNADGEYEMELYDLLLPILKEELKNETEIDPNTNLRPDTSSNGSFTSDDAYTKSERDTTFKIEGRNIQNMAAIYERQQFKLYRIREKGKRGKALIINILNFIKPTDQFTRHLEQRYGATLDGEKMTALFEDLGFAVRMYVDVDNAELERILMKYNSLDHSDSDAFICCIMTHGNLGQIYTSDCKPYNILSVVDMFTPDKCETLRGKPKLFFVQSCQRGYDSKEDGDYDRLVGDKNLTLDSAPDEIFPGQSLQVKLGYNSVKKQQIISKKGLTADKNSNEMAGFSHARLSSRSSSYEMLDTELRATLVPGHPDILMSYSALPGSLSYRDKYKGSLYIDALATNLRKHQEIDRALKNVTKDVVEKLKTYEANGHSQVQLPFHLTTGMSKLLYLTPTRKTHL